MIKYGVDWQKSGFSESVKIGTKFCWFGEDSVNLYEVLCHNPPIIKYIESDDRNKNKLFLFDNNYWKSFSEYDIIDGEELIIE